MTVIAPVHHDVDEELQLPIKQPTKKLSSYAGQKRQKKRPLLYFITHFVLSFFFKTDKKTQRKTTENQQKKTKIIKT